MRVYGVDLLDLWRGSLSLRRVGVLIRHMPTGSALAREMGGDAFWSDEVAAIMYGLWRIECTIIGSNGGKTSDYPKRPEPPEEGWIEKAEAKATRERAKAERWLARHPEVQATM